jgi:hypothetical protein
MGEVRNLSVPHFTPAPCGIAIGEARTSVSPTPSVVDWSRRIEGDCVALIAPRFTPARLTQSSTSLEVEDR